MLVPSDVKHFHSHTRHPHHSAITAAFMQRLVVTVDDAPIDMSRCFHFDAVNGFVKLYKKPVENDGHGRAKYYYLKGRVRVFEKAENA